MENQPLGGSNHSEFPQWPDPKILKESDYPLPESLRVSETLSEETPPPPTPKKVKRKLLPVVLGIVFLLLILALVGGVTILARKPYNLPFLNTQQKLTLLRLTSHIPLIPKTNSQIALAILESTNQVTSYQNEGSFSLNLVTQNAPTDPLASFSLDSRNLLDFSRAGDPQGELEVTISLNISPELYGFEYSSQETSFSDINLKLKAKLINKILYLNLEEAYGLDFLFQYLDFNKEELVNQWYSTDLSEYFAEWEKRGQNQQSLGLPWLYSGSFSPQLPQFQEGAGTKILHEIITRGILDEIKQDQEKIIEGRKNWHFSLCQKDGSLQRFLFKLIEEFPNLVDELEDEEIKERYKENYDPEQLKDDLEEIFSHCESLDIDLYIDKELLFVGGGSLHMVVKLPDNSRVLGAVDNLLTWEESFVPSEPSSSLDDFSSLMQDLYLEIKLEGINKNINQPVTITAPSVYKDLSLLFEDAFGPGYKQARDSGTKSNLGYCSVYLESYYTKHQGKYPSSLAELAEEEKSTLMCRVPEGRKGAFPEEENFFGYKALNDQEECVVYAQLEYPPNPSKPYFIYYSKEGKSKEASAEELTEIMGEPPKALELTPTPTPSFTPTPTPVLSVTPSLAVPTKRPRFGDLLD